MAFKTTQQPQPPKTCGKFHDPAIRRHGVEGRELFLYADGGKTKIADIIQGFSIRDLSAAKRLAAEQDAKIYLTPFNEELRMGPASLTSSIARFQVIRSGETVEVFAKSIYVVRPVEGSEVGSLPQDILG